MNSTLTVKLSAGRPANDYTRIYGPYMIKGITPVVFNLFNVDETANPVLKISGGFGDGEEYSDTLVFHNTIDTADAIGVGQSGKTASIAQQIYHTYVKQTSSFVTSVTAVFLLEYTSGVRGIHKIKFDISKDSYYSTVGEIDLLSTQLLPTSSHDIFAVASNATGDVFNLYLSKNNLPQYYTNDVADTLSISAMFTHSGLPVVTRFNQLYITPIL